MGIFRREQSDVQLAGAAPSVEPEAQASQARQQAKLVPPFVPPSKGATAPGVVPPPAAPIYSTLPPEPDPRAEGDAESLVAEKVRTTRDGEQRVQERIRVNLRRARTAASPSTGVRTQPPVRQPFDAVRCAQTGLLNLAWGWQEAGAPIRAIHTYMQVLQRYPDTAAADAAVADLVKLSDILVAEGQFHTALGIYEQLEELL